MLTYSDRKGPIILNNYLTALKNYGWDDERILNDLDGELMTMTKEANNWSQWKNTMESWMADINKWEKPHSQSARRENLYERSDITLESLETSAYYNKCSADDRIESIIHIGSAFPNFNTKAFVQDAALTILTFINQLQELYDASTEIEIDEDESYVSNFVDSCSLTEYFNLPDNASNYGVLIILSEKSRDILEDMISVFYLPRTLYKRKDIDIMLKLYRQYYDEQYANR